MALVNSCVCCSLMQGCIVCGIYSMFVYLVAFALELWWIIDSEEGLPAPAYILGACYLLVFVNSIIMLAGLNTKKTRFLLGWLLMMVLFLFPECGMVLFMSLYHWKIDSMHGLAELVFYICRASINVMAVICVQSLYTTWRDERTLALRLQTLNLYPVYGNGNIALHSLQNGHTGIPKGVTLGYQNSALITPNDKETTRRTTLKRSASSVSHMGRYSNPAMFSNSVPNNMVAYPPYPLPFRKDGSEFNASTFSGLFPVIPHRTNSELALNGVKMPNKAEWLHKAYAEDWYPMGRTQSLDRVLLKQRRDMAVLRQMHSSHSSMGGASDDITKYKDVAL